MISDPLPFPMISLVLSFSLLIINQNYKMMRRFLSFFLSVAISMFVAAQQAQPTVKTAKKLSDLSPVVRAEIDRLASDDAGKRATGAASLAEMGDDAIPAIPYLIGALNDTRSVIGPGGQSTVAEVALATLDKLGEPGRLAMLEALKAGSDRRGFDQLMLALGRIKEPRAFEPLVGWLADAHWGQWAARALGELGDVRAVNPLILALMANNSSAASALGKLKDPRAVEPLIEAFDSDVSQKYLLQEALEEITGESMKADEWKGWWEKNKDSYKKN
jgi:HEAT repeat protein